MLRERNTCINNDAKNKTKNTMNKIWAKEADVAAIPEKPKKPATSDNTKNVITQDNILILLLFIIN